VSLGTEQREARVIPDATLAELAAQDPSALVRLAVASTLPLVGPEACWTIGSALAARGEDASDRFLPGMIWFGLARVVPEDGARALALAEATRIPVVADWIRWSVASTPAGRDRLVEFMATAPEAVAARQLRLFAFALEQESVVERPVGWARVHARFAGPGDPAVRRVAE
jgi:hypothetical protein